MSKPAILHLGCGNKKAPEAIGVDFNPKSQADIIHDLNEVPWPLESDAFNLVILEHVIEHLNDVVQVMAELYRVCDEGAIVKVVTPHFSSVNSWDDPTHRHHFTLASFDYFTGDHPFSYCEANFEILERRLTFSKSFTKILARLLCRISPRWYEKHFAFMMPARNLEMTLRARKLATLE